MSKRPFLPWVAGGALLASVLLVATVTMKPLGVSTQYVRAAGGLVEAIAPDSAASCTYLQKTGIRFGYAEAMLLGIPVGGLLAALATRRFRRREIPDTWKERFGSRRGRRFVAAFAGGVLLLFGARLAGGCTSGHILSGISQLAISSIGFFVFTFASAMLVSRALFAGSRRA